MASSRAVLGKVQDEYRKVVDVETHSKSGKDAAKEKKRQHQAAAISQRPGTIEFRSGQLQ